MSACEKCGQWQRAVDLLDDLRNLRKRTTTSSDGGELRPDDISYNAAIFACCRAGRWEQAVILLKEMQGCAIPLDTIGYSATVDACEAAEAFLVTMTQLSDLRLCI